MAFSDGAGEELLRDDSMLHPVPDGSVCSDFEKFEVKSRGRLELFTIIAAGPRPIFG
jgi:hypothetical protein